MDNLKKQPGFLFIHKLNSSDNDQTNATWLHMCIHHSETTDYLMDIVKLNDLIVDAMVKEDTRSRIRVEPEGIMILLKAMDIHSNTENSPENMASMRIWVDEARIITTREADVDPITEMHTRFLSQKGPTRTGEFITDLIEYHLNELAPYIEALEDKAYLLDDSVQQHKISDACHSLSSVQLQVLGFLRHLAPQKPVLEELEKCQLTLLRQRDKKRIAESINTLEYFIEILQNIKERTTILSEQINRIQDRQLNKTSYTFSVAATIFLPLMFITGLFGTNLLGIPFASHTLGFWFLSFICIGISLLLLIFIIWKKWL